MVSLWHMGEAEKVREGQVKMGRWFCGSCPGEGARPASSCAFRGLFVVLVLASDFLRYTTRC
jgi:hypothetical protein